ncbi:MAG: hypothetical protein ACYDD6_08365, partial [Acidimicrobiales bacterium]
KLQRKGESLGMVLPGAQERCRQLSAGLQRLGLAGGERSGETLDAAAEEWQWVGELLFAVADAARRMGVDPETALRAYAGRFRRQVEASE